MTTRRVVGVVGGTIAVVAVAVVLMILQGGPAAAQNGAIDGPPYEVRPDVATARSLWDATKPDDYTYTATVPCVGDCSDAQFLNEPMANVTVIGGVPSGQIVNGPGAPYEGVPGEGLVRSIDAVFDFLEAGDVPVVSISYHPTLGYPRSIYSCWDLRQSYCSSVRYDDLVAIGPVVDPRPALVCESTLTPSVTEASVGDTVTFTFDPGCDCPLGDAGACNSLDLAAGVAFDGRYLQGEYLQFGPVGSSAVFTATVVQTPDFHSARGVNVSYVVSHPADLVVPQLVQARTWVEIVAPPEPPCQFVDEFDGADLDRVEWGVVRETSGLQVAGSSLNIPLTATDIHKAFNNAPNLVLRDMPADSFTAETKVTMAGTTKYEQAGLVVYGDDDNYVKMTFQARDVDAASRVFQWLREDDQIPDEFNTPLLGANYPSTVWMRITSDGTTLTAAYSHDGVQWINMLVSRDLPESENLRIGLMAVAGNAGVAGEVAVFDSFSVTRACGPPIGGVTVGSGFVCSSDAGNLSWGGRTNSQHKYWIYRSIDDGATFTWLGSTSPSTSSFVDPAPVQGALYQVHFQGIPRIDCAIESEPAIGGGFACSSDAGNLSWTDDGAGKYWVYRSTDAGATYSWLGRTIGSPAPTTFADPAPVSGALYQVHYQGIPRIDCAILSEPAVGAGFSCTNVNGDLNWSDHGQTKYWVYRSTDGGQTYTWLGRTLGATSFQDPNPVSGALYQVHYAGIPRANCSV